ncbi:hypothetical protein [Brunnivagina elsteri]|uniref:Uncharacterized protein n=1 Tax=Brunnivagina elsteri CCALA 953 TaxID=987040 RepID=A0A2A2TNA6_9CYAN|nr:hypothetical protein [Calothrix elsteri]PAX59969.1 hypothetical protein CK510_04310 [Calothrix elsteri CCALA 953]
MQNSEGLIQTFLQVVEDYPEVFDTEMIDDFDNLNKKIIELENQPNQEIADAIQKWLYKYPSLAEFVMDVWQPPAVRKPKPKLVTEPQPQSPSPKYENTLTNRYPDLPKNLIKRIDSTPIETKSKPGLTQSNE